MSNLIRLDTYLVKRGDIVSREKAKTEIENGNVIVNNKCVNKASTKVDEELDIIEFVGIKQEYVGRGAYKLEHAINEFNIVIKDKVCIDIGASTGGFTEVMLKYDAAKVYAIDVGHSQLSEKLINDSRVINLEKTNIRYFDKQNIIDVISFISVDVSFISLTLVIPKVFELLGDGCLAVCLIKPQFEVGRGNLDKNGIVKNKKQYEDVKTKIKECSINNGFEVIGIINSPIDGTDGNEEFLICLKKN